MKKKSGLEQTFSVIKHGAQDAVSFVKKEVGAVERKLEAEAEAIAIRNLILGGAVGIVVGIVGTSLWEKFVTPMNKQV